MEVARTLLWVCSMQRQPQSPCNTFLCREVWQVMLKSDVGAVAHLQHVVTAFKSLQMPSMPSPGGGSSVGDAPSLSFSPLPVGTFAIDFPKEPADSPVHTHMGHVVTSPPPMARSLAVGGVGPPAMWTHTKEPLRRCALASFLCSSG